MSEPQALKLLGSRGKAGHLNQSFPKSYNRLFWSLRLWGALGRAISFGAMSANAIFRHYPVYCAQLNIFLCGFAASSTDVKAKKPTLKEIQAFSCPTCGVAPGEKCELFTGQPRTQPHRDRRLIAAD